MLKRSHIKGLLPDQSTDVDTSHDYSQVNTLNQTK